MIKIQNDDIKQEDARQKDTRQKDTRQENTKQDDAMRHGTKQDDKFQIIRANTPNIGDIKKYSLQELEDLSQKIREKILATVSKNGGHLSSTLGAVEAIVAMHVVFEPLKDPFIFDVSHQSYAHKLLTGRWEEFDSLRQFEGISGYTKPSENQCDYFVAGHSSTSISLAVGAAKAIRLKGEEDSRVPVVMIGDGAMSAGMAYEALNELGHRKYPVVIILNDNEMSIAKPIGAISNYLSQAMAGKFYQKLKKKSEEILAHMPEGARYMAKKFEESLRLITPGILFEELGLEYMGPMNGHDLEGLIDAYKKAKDLKKPIIVHIQTTKGKGYKVAEGHLEHWHGVGPFDLKSGEFPTKKGAIAATELFSQALFDLAQRHQNVVGVTAAMPSGTGMGRLMERFPDRFWDVAIAEQHAVTSMCSLAKEGFKPFVAIYSTFLQRAYDQVIHDACIMNLPVTFAIDRAGIVGEDGETHQGVYDISYLRVIPNMTLFAPRDEKSMALAVEFAYKLNSPSSFRYPRGAFFGDFEHFGDLYFKAKEFELGKGEILKNSESSILFIGYGNGVGRALATLKAFCEMDPSFDAAIVDLRFCKPLDEDLLRELCLKYSHWFVFSDSAKIGGVGSALGEFLDKENISNIALCSFEYDDIFIPHGKTKDIEKDLRLLPEQLAQRVKDYLAAKTAKY